MLFLHEVPKNTIQKIQMAKITILLCSSVQQNNSLSFYFSIVRQPVIKCDLKSTYLNNKCNLLVITDPSLSHESMPFLYDSPGLFKHIGLCSRKTVKIVSSMINFRSTCYHLLISSIFSTSKVSSFQLPGDICSPYGCLAAAPTACF